MAPPQPKRLTSYASAPQLTGGSIDRERSDERPPPGYSTEGTLTRPGLNPLAKTGSTASLGQSASVALYGAPSFSALYVQPEDLEPGPGTYDFQSGMGNQISSTRHSGPSVTITAKHSKSWDKVLISKEHNEAFKARSTPGPGTYKPQEAATQARVRFGTGKRSGLSDSSFRAPGPVYEVRGVPDNPVAQIRFGKAERFSRDGVSLAGQLAQAGPGQYEVGTVFDGVALAKSFGASHRAYDHVRFPGAEKTEYGKNSPGPGPLKPLYNDSIRMSFGRAERLPGNNSAKRGPGPGAYENHERPYPFSRNQSTYSFGRPHARPRMDWKIVKNLGNSTWGLQP